MTTNQPETYLNQAPGDLLLLAFVAPETRLPSLWNELLQRACIDAGSAIATTTRSGYATKTGNGVVMGLTSWRALLAGIRAELQAAGETRVLEDVRQLEALCEHMDSDAFLPLSGDELAPIIGRRINQFCDLVDDITRDLVQRGVADTSGHRESATKGAYGRYFRLGNYTGFLSWDARRWGRLGETPLWLMIQDGKWQSTRQVETAVRQSGVAELAPIVKDGNDTVIPLRLVLGVERDEVRRSAVELVSGIAGKLTRRDDVGSP